MVHYDIPWNPMTLEQRIRRIDHIGQERQEVDIVNLFYEDTTEWDAYEAMRERLANIHGQVGQYQPILYDPATANQLADIIRSNAKSSAIRDAVSSISNKARLNLDVLNSALSGIEPAPAKADVSKERTFESNFAMALRAPRKKRSRPRPDPETNPPLLRFDSNGE